MNNLRRNSRGLAFNQLAVIHVCKNNNNKKCLTIFGELLQMKRDLKVVPVSKENQESTLVQDNDKPNFLCVLIDLSISLFDRLLQPKDNTDKRDLAEANALQTFLLQLITFLHVFLVSNFANRIVVFVYNENTVQLVYEDPSVTDPLNSTTSLLTEERQGRLTLVDSQILKNVANFIDSHSYDSAEMGTLLSAALSFALCYLHRRVHSETHDARILCLHASADVPYQYIGVMNSIFCAQHYSILIDVCNLYEEDSSLLQNAAHLTGGIYFKPSHLDSIPLLNYLCNLYFPSRDARKYFHLPVMDTIDCSALCFESGEKIRMGYICSVCLATFGRKRSSCAICGAEFKEMDSCRKQIERSWPQK